MTTEVRRATSLTGVSFAMLAAVLFGASTPFTKILLGKTEPIMLAGLLYLSSGVGLAIWSKLRSRSKESSREAKLGGSDLPWLAGAIVAGGIIGPVLLMVGLVVTTASSASLLLNLEGVFTALLAWFVFKENFDRRIAWGMAAITCGGLFISWQAASSWARSGALSRLAEHAWLGPSTITLLEKFQRETRSRLPPQRVSLPAS